MGSAHAKPPPRACESWISSALMRRKPAADRAAENAPMPKLTHRRSLVWLLLLAAALPLSAQTRDRPIPGEFVVVDGRVDAGTYAGWKLYHTACYVCHG